MISRFYISWSKIFSAFNLQGEYAKSLEQRVMTSEIRYFEMAFNISGLYKSKNIKK
jgi:hypothetical protein